MIVNGASRSSVGFWTKHLANDEKNDRAELKEIRGLAAENLRDGLLEMQQDAKNTRLKNFFYQANFNPAAEEKLTEEQWQRAFEIFEKHRGIPEGTARIVYEHEKEGRIHRHVIWSRMDTEKGRAWSDALDAKKCHEAAREISEELNLHRSISPFDKDREGPRPERAPESWEMFRGLKSNLDPRAIKQDVTRIYRESENAVDFVTGLQQHGYQLVQGDRRDFCIMDSAGEIHSLARRLDGVKAKELRSYMRDFPREMLPTVHQAKAHFREGNLAERIADLETVQKEIAYEEAIYRSAVRKERNEKRFLEPTARQIREERLKTEKRWPLLPPAPEQTEIPAKYHFQEAARETTRTRDQGLPKELKGISVFLMKAYRNSKEGYRGTNLDGYNTLPTLQESIDRMGIGFARATREEADGIHRQAEFAKAVGNYAPRIKEGEIVAVRAWNSIQRRDGQMIPPGQKIYRVDQEVARSIISTLNLEKSLTGLETTKKIMEARVELLSRANAEKSHKTRLKDATKLQGAGRRMGQRGHLDSLGIPKSTRTVVSGAIKAFGAVNTLADMFGSIISPDLSPQEVQRGEDATNIRKADGELAVDLERFTTSKNFEIQRQQDREIEGSRESERER